MIEELEAERDFLLRSIEDLDAEHAAGDIAEADYTALRDDYVARAADVLRRIEGHAAPAAPVRAPRRGRAVVTVAVSLAVALAAGLALANSAGSRSEGEQLSGSLPRTTRSELQRARQLVGEKKLVEALKIYDAVIKREPTNPVALAERGWLVRLAGLKDEAFGYVDRAIAADPRYPDAHFFRGMMLWEDRGDPKAAVEEFRLCLANDPSPEFASLVENALKQAAADAGIPVE